MDSGKEIYKKVQKFKAKIISCEELEEYTVFDTRTKKEYDVLAILSGPEPQRTIFEEMILEQLENNKLKAVIVRGLPNENSETGELIFNHLPTQQLQDYIIKSKIVVCRAGYSSIMDLAILNKKAIIVPTPGQTEQEYLSQYHNEQGNFYTQQQKEFNLKKGLLEIESLIPKLDFDSNIKLDFLLINE